MSILPVLANLEYYCSHFCGLAPFARANLASTNLVPLGQAMLERAARDEKNAILFMNLSLILQSFNQHDTGVAMQAEALTLQRVYTLAADIQPANFRLLVLCVEGDIAENTPIDCLLESMDIELIYYYVSNRSDTLFSSPIPEHDAVMVAICESDTNLLTIQALTPLLKEWSKPVINQPEHIVNTGRKVASLLLQGTEGLLMPATFRASRAQLLTIVQDNTSPEHIFKHTPFPIILRPLGSHAGHDLEQINTILELADYLNRVDAEVFFISRFIDYRSEDGLFRKFRVMLIDGNPFIAHMAVSSHWMIHYVNAGMYEDEQKRSEEALIMTHFDNFIAQHRLALNAIYQRTRLDYLGIDCAQTSDGKLLVFEIDHVMVVHDMDPETLFPYKHQIIMKIKNAFRDMLIRISKNNTKEKII
jgi:glutathione synthase/RimK-type ligase-like ATP-grasp enzyme